MHKHIARSIDPPLVSCECYGGEPAAETGPGRLLRQRSGRGDHRSLQNQGVGWCIDSSPTATLVTSALGMAIGNRRPNGTVVYSDQGTQLTSWVFTHRARQYGLLPSMGSIGDYFDNAVIESF